MKQTRPAFAFNLAIVIIILLGITIIGLIFVLNTISEGENPYMATQPAPSWAESTEVVGETTTSYLNVLENYKEIEMEEFSQDQAKKENSASLVSQKSEASKNALSTRIDEIVSKSLKE